MRHCQFDVETKRKKMKLKSLIILLFILSTISLNAQKTENYPENTTVWEAITPERFYTIKLFKEQIEINITVGINKYSYKYKLLKKNKGQYFKFEDDSLCITINENLLNLNYCKNDIRVIVNEIATLTFKKVE